MNKNIDGWTESFYTYNGFRFCIKAKQLHGMKMHIFNPGIGDWKDKVLYTERYNFIDPDKLIERAKKSIDRIVDLINKKDGIIKTDIQFMVNGIKVNFTVVHNLPEMFGMSLLNAIDCWAYRTKEYGVDSFVKYVSGKNTGYHCMSLNNYLRKGLQNG